MVLKKNLDKPKIGILTGPTATGKTSLAIELCLELQSKINKKIRILNADSLLFYQEFNIGTAKPTPEEQKGIPHLFLDHLHPESFYSAGDFYQQALQEISKHTALDEHLLIVGGSGFYIKPFLYGSWNAPKAPLELREKLEKKETPLLWQELLNHYNVNESPKFSAQDRYRIIRALEIILTTGKTPEVHENEHKKKELSPFHSELWVIDWPKEILQKRIQQRTRIMFQQGWLEEVKKLNEKYPKARALKSVGYREILKFFNQERPSGRKLKPGMEGLENEIFIANSQLIKKQRTWFRGEKKSQHFILEKDLKLLKNKFFEFYKK